MVQENEEFKTVVYKKSRGKKKIFKENLSDVPSVDDDDFNIDDFMKRLQNIRQDLVNSNYFQKLIEKLISLPNTYENILCLGLGRISSCQIALHQLSLLLELKTALRTDSVTVFDPVFSKQEKEVLEVLGCLVPEENLQGKHIVEQGILAYFPHCPHELTDSFLSVNWSPESLENTALLCNSFERFTTTEPTRVVEERTPFIARIVDFTEIQEVENTYKFEDVFNDTAIHWFLKERLSEQGHEFWEK